MMPIMMMKIIAIRIRRVHGVRLSQGKNTKKQKQTSLFSLFVLPFISISSSVVFVTHFFVLFVYLCVFFLSDRVTDIYLFDRRMR